MTEPLDIAILAAALLLEAAAFSWWRARTICCERAGAAERLEAAVNSERGRADAVVAALKEVVQDTRTDCQGLLDRFQERERAEAELRKAVGAWVPPAQPEEQVDTDWENPDFSRPEPVPDEAEV